MTEVTAYGYMRSRLKHGALLGVEHCKVISNRLYFQCKLNILLIPSLHWLVCVGFLCSFFSNKTHGDKILITCLLLFD